MSTQPDRVSGDAASFIGNIPEHFLILLGAFAAAAAAMSLPRAGSHSPRGGSM